MPNTTRLKIVALAALFTLSLGSLQASASETPAQQSLCNDNFGFNTLVPAQVTPALLETLRQLSGAATVRHEEPGKGYSRDYRKDRLRVFSTEGNILSHYTCG